MALLATPKPSDKPGKSAGYHKIAEHHSHYARSLSPPGALNVFAGKHNYTILTGAPAKSALWCAQQAC